MNHESLNHENKDSLAYWPKFDERWRRNGQWMLYVVRVDAYTQWSNWDGGLEKEEDCTMKEMEGKMLGVILLDVQS